MTNNQKCRKKDQNPFDQNRATFANKCVSAITNFNRFEDHPETSAILYHLNSGHEKFRNIDIIQNLSHEQLTNLNENKAFIDLKKEILDEMLTDTDKKNLVSLYLRQHGKCVSWEETNFPTKTLMGLPKSVDALHLVCALCGIKSIHGRYGKCCTVIALSDLHPSIKLTEQQRIAYELLKSEPPLVLPVNEKGDTENFHLHKLRSVYSSPHSNQLYHLHPEFVHCMTDETTGLEKECITVCPSCSSWFEKKNQKEPPPNSIAAGIDFGNPDRLNLTTPSLAELKVLACHRHYHNLLAIRNNHIAGQRSDFTKAELRAHSILFRHDSPDIASLTLMMDQINRQECPTAMNDMFRKTLTIEFVGHAHSIDLIARKLRCQTHLQTRAHVIYQHLAIFQRCHTLYKKMTCLKLPSFKNLSLGLDVVYEGIMTNCIAVTDRSVINADLVQGDDVSQVRTHILTDEEANALNESSMNHNKSKNDMHLSTSCVKRHELKSTKLNHPDSNEEVFNKEIIQKAAEAFGIQTAVNQQTENSNGGHTIYKSEREGEPLNEFLEMEELLTGAFPTIFMFGNAYNQKSSLNHCQIEHLLLQFTNAAATNKELLFYLHDCQERHKVINNFAAKVRKDPKAFETYASMVKDQNFQEMLQQAVLQPTSKVAKKVLKTVLPVLSFGGKNTMAGALGDTTSLSRAMAMAKRYGPPSVMLTVTPDDINNPTSFRLACKSHSNISFPACTTQAFHDNFKNSKSIDSFGNINIPLNYTQRVKRANANPVAIAIEFRAIVENILTILIGCPLDYQPGNNSKQVRTWHFEAKATNSPYHKGIFGNVTAYFGCIETQARGALHFHAIIWGGINPKLLEQSAGFPALCETISKVLDSMHCAELPLSYHVKHFLTEKMKQSHQGREMLPESNKIYPSMQQVPSPTCENDHWNILSHQNILRTGMHKHSFTCKKPPAGRCRCRMAYPAGINSKTQPILLQTPESDLKAQTPLSQIKPEIVQGPIQPLAPFLQRNYFSEPIRPVDERWIVWEIKRPSLNALPPLSNSHKAMLQIIAEKQKQTSDDILEIDLFLQDARRFCMKSLSDVLSTNPEDLSGIQDWMQRLESLDVVTMYQDLQFIIEKANGNVVATNSTIHNVTGSSTNSILLGNSQQSKSSLFYVAPYLCKNKVALEACLVALEKAQKHINKHPSVASDTGTNKREVQHMFTRVVNELSRSIQISETQVALALLNMGTELTTDSYKYFGAKHSVNHFIFNLITNNGSVTPNKIIINGVPKSFQGDCNESNFLQDTKDEDDSSESHCQQDAQDDMDIADWDEMGNPFILNQDFGPAPIYRKPLQEETCETNKEFESTPVHYPDHWWFRGEDLRNLTMMEYSALIDIVPLSKLSNFQEADEGDTLRGRKTRHCFKFHPNHKLSLSHVQCLRAKQPTLIFNERPPRHPGMFPQPQSSSATNFETQEHQRAVDQWHEKAFIFASYYLSIYFPHPDLFGDDIHWDTQTCVDYLSWNRFCSLIQQMESSNLLIDRLRLDAMFIKIHGFQTDFKRAQMFTNFRHRDSTIWSKKEKAEATLLYASVGQTCKSSKYSQEEDDNFINDRMTTAVFGSAAMNNAFAAMQFSKSMLRTIKKIFNQNDSQTLGLAANDFNSRNHLMWETPDRETYLKGMKLCTEQFNMIQPSPNLNGTTNYFYEPPDSTLLATAFVAGRNLSESQTWVINRTFDYFVKVKNVIATRRNMTKWDWSFVNYKGIDPLKLLMTGDPGAGKSYVIETLVGLADIMKLGFVGTTSYNGIAAVNIDGNTLSSMFSFFPSTSADSIYDQSSKDNLDQCTKLNLGEMCLLVVDEVSTIDTRHIALIDLRLQVLQGNELPFGGMPILFAGDFNQLGPVKKNFIPMDMMAWALRLRKNEKEANSFHKLNSHQSPPVANNKVSFQNMAKHFKIKVAKMKDGKTHASMSKKEKEANRLLPHTLHYRGCTLFASLVRFHLTEQHRSDDGDHNVIVKKLSNGQSLTVTEILTYDHLSYNDIQQSPDEWKYAPVVVTTNIERLTISRHKAIQWAKDNKTHVYKWRNKLGREENRPCQLDMQNGIENENPFFWQYWVKDAVCYLSSNINGELALVNGSPMRCHSLIFTTPEEYDLATALHATLPFGSEIEINQPIAVNMAISESLDGKPVSSKRKAQLHQLKKFSILPSDQEIVISLTVKMNRNKTKYKKYSYATNNLIFPIATACVVEPFPFDLGFAVTVHKAQGRTLYRVVLDLTFHPNIDSRVNFAQLFVAISRVKSKQHLRLLPRHNFNPTKAYHYIQSLKPAHSTFAFYNGYEGIAQQGLVWNYNKALDTKSL